MRASKTSRDPVSGRVSAAASSFAAQALPDALCYVAMPAPSHHRTVLLALVFAPTLHAASKCYGIDGTPSDDSYRPCDPDAQFSACCATNKDRGDICMSSGLCYSQDAGYEGFIYSNGCTDPTGRAEACPHFCPDRKHHARALSRHGTLTRAFVCRNQRLGGRPCRWLL